MNGMQSHSQASTHASIYLGMLPSHVQNFAFFSKMFSLMTGLLLKM